MECVRCVCVWLGPASGFIRGLGFTNPVGTGSVGRVSVFSLR